MENKYNDRNTLDQAWSMMRTTLDREMPVRKKRRAIWWIPFGLGLIALASWVYIFSSANTDTKVIPHEQIQKTVESKPIASNEVEQTSTIINQTESIISEDTKSIENIAFKTKNTPNSRSNKKNKAITKTVAVLKSAVSNQESKSPNLKPSNQIIRTIVTRWPEKLDTKELIKNPSLNQQNLKTEESAKTKMELQANKLVTEELIVEERLVSKLIDPLPILNNQKLNLDAVSNVELSYPNVSKWNLGLKTAVLSDLKFDSPTLLVEGQVRRKMGTRWSFISGLGIKSQNLQIDLATGNLFDVSAEESADAFSPIFGIDLDFNNDKEASAIGVNNSNSSIGKRSFAFNFLYIPIGLKYNFKGRWSIDAGVHYNFLELSGESSRSSTLRRGTQRDIQENSNLILSVKNYSRRNFNHFSYYMGMNYRLGKRASLSVQYQGNTKRFGVESPKIDAHQFGVGMNWQF